MVRRARAARLRRIRGCQSLVVSWRFLTKDSRSSPSPAVVSGRRSSGRCSHGVAARASAGVLVATYLNEYGRRAAARDPFGPTS
jgi:hypothetical protein